MGHNTADVSTQADHGGVHAEGVTRVSAVSVGWLNERVRTRHRLEAVTSEKLGLERKLKDEVGQGIACTAPKAPANTHARARL